MMRYFKMLLIIITFFVLIVLAAINSNKGNNDNPIIKTYTIEDYCTEKAQRYSEDIYFKTKDSEQANEAFYNIYIKCKYKDIIKK